MRARRRDAGQRLLGRARLADDLDVVLGRQQGGDAAAHHLMIVQEKDPDNLVFVGRWVRHDISPLVSWCRPLFDASRKARGRTAPRSPIRGTKVPKWTPDRRREMLNG
ncbi:hypothetical protein Acsp04_31490 [Actinomadura sp. NBRC 104425]|nr:hypothetical protein Acsp04_31490 [Actinomadura sp. NBRC 104425]